MEAVLIRLSLVLGNRIWFRFRYPKTELHVWRTLRWVWKGKPMKRTGWEPVRFKPKENK